MSSFFLYLSVMLQSIKLLSNNKILHVSIWKTKHANQRCALRAVSNLQHGFQNKSYPCTVCYGCPVLPCLPWHEHLSRGFLSLILTSWGILSEAKKVRWHCVFTDYPKRSTHIGLMRIWRWEKVRAALISSSELDPVWCALWGLQGLHSGSAAEALSVFSLCLSGSPSLVPAPRLEEVTWVCEWHQQHLWIVANSCSFELMFSCTWSQTNADVLPKHMGGAVAVDLLCCCFRSCLVILKRLRNVMQSLELRKWKGLASRAKLQSL